MTVTYNHIVNYLLKNGWESVDSNDRFIFFKPPVSMGFPQSYKLKVPIRFNSDDYNSYLKHTAQVIAGYYDKNPEELFYGVDNYLDVLKRNAVYLKLASNEVQFDHTIAISHISTFLRNLTSSFESYTRIRFKQLFSEKFRFDGKKIMQASNKFVDLSTMRLVDLEFKSFSFGVSVDTMMGKEYIDYQEIKDWREELLPRFEDDVLEADYYSREGIDNIIEKFESEEERKAIYAPIFRSINTDQYQISITDSDYSPKKMIKRVPKSTVQIITPSKIKQKSDVDFYNLIVPIGEGESGKIRIKKSDLKNSLFADKINTSELDKLRGDGRFLIFQNPLKVSLDTTQEGNFILSIDRFNIVIEATSFPEAQKNLIDTLWALYDLWEQNSQEFQNRDDAEALSSFFKDETIFGDFEE